MYLVTGASGNVGSEVVTALLAAGEHVRALTRGASPATLPVEVEAVVGDLDKPETLGDALICVRGAYLLPGYKDMPGDGGEEQRRAVDNPATARLHVEHAAVVASVT